ncbi:MAG: hypothetical protein AABZ01_13380 [Gemmatimonadota bacterium]
MDRRRSLRLITAGSMVALAVGCTPAAEAPPPVDATAHEAAAAALWPRYGDAVLAANLEGVMTLYSDMATVDVKGFPPMDKPALMKLLGELFATTRTTEFTVTPEYTHVVGEGLVHQAGRYREATVPTGEAAATGKPMTEYGRFAGALVREADGQWRIMYLMAFTDSTVTR